jgi:hypothetical protein
MTTTTISTTRASLRKLAAQNGWTVNAVKSDNSLDVFDRGDHQVTAAFRSFGDTAGMFLAAFLVDLTNPLAGSSGDGIIDEGRLSRVRGWLKAAV